MSPGKSATARAISSGRIRAFLAPGWSGNASSIRCAPTIWPLAAMAAAASPVRSAGFPMPIPMR